MPVAGRLMWFSKQIKITDCNKISQTFFQILNDSEKERDNEFSSTSSYLKGFWLAVVISFIYLCFLFIYFLLQFLKTCIIQMT